VALELEAKAALEVFARGPAAGETYERVNRASPGFLISGLGN